MSKKLKNLKQILQKLQIKSLNDMQESAKLAIHNSKEVILLSPTGTGKTLAFLLPIIGELEEDVKEVQSIIIAPTRELAIQIEQVLREMGTGFKVNAIYGGGKSFSKDKLELQHPPAIIVGTPGRINHHLNKKTFETSFIKTVVLDEFDKSLEIGFEEEMKNILEQLPFIEKKILTSATNLENIPDFVELSNPITIDFLSESKSKLELKTIVSPEKDKLSTLYNTICHLGEQSGIVFCNYKDSIQRISKFLDENKIEHGCFYGGMEQLDRERTIIKFKNGTIRIIVATDLAARGLDIEDLNYIIHYHLPVKKEEFTHRNGRTARIDKGGTAYIIKWEQETLPEYMPPMPEEQLTLNSPPPKTKWQTLFISGGRKDKISKGDIAGFFIKQGNLEPNEVGSITLKRDCSFIAIDKSKVVNSIQKLNNTRLKSKKVRIFKI